MNSRTMVKLTSYQHGIEFRTFNRERESRSFYMRRDELSELERKEKITAYDGSSFAVLCKDAAGGLVNIRFAWLCSREGQLHGYEETLNLPYGEIAAFVENSQMAGGSKHCRLLSAAAKAPQPQFVFFCTERLHECLAVRAVRRKLVRVLRDKFYWSGSEQIQFYDGFEPYSFIFQVIRGGQL